MRSIPPLLLALGFVLASCKKEPVARPEPIVAKIAFQPMQPGESVQATLSSASVMGRAPTQKLKRLGVFRAVDVNNTLAASFTAFLEERGPETTRWRIEFETFDSVMETSEQKQAATDYALTGTSLHWAETAEGVAVTTAAQTPATASQTEVANALVHDLANRDAWGTFLSSREFEQGKITEAPEGLYLGGIVEASLGEIDESHTTVSLFRLGLESGDEVAFFDVATRLKTVLEDGVYHDVVASGKAVVRIVDGEMLRYELEGKVTPRAPTGEMLPSGSGRWEASMVVDAR